MTVWVIFELLPVQVDQTPEKERDKFLKYKETFKIDEDPARKTVNYQKREYSVSQVSIIRSDYVVLPHTRCSGPRGVELC